MSDILNDETMEIVIGDAKLKARKLNISELFGYFENIIRDEKIEMAKLASSKMDKEEKFEFLQRIIENLPTGDNIINKAIMRVDSLKGYKEIIYLATRDLNEEVDSPDFFNKLITVDNVKELDPIVNRVTGFGEVKKNTKEKVKEKVD